MLKPNLLVISGVGLNCEDETAFAFAEVGFLVDKIHIASLIAKPDVIDKYQMLIFPGGFSYGDQLGSGTVFSMDIRYNLLDKIKTFLNEKKLVLGICNGCQIMTKLFFNDVVSIAQNKHETYVCAWQSVDVVANSKASNIWYKDIDKGELPVAHGEGRFLFDDKSFKDMADQGMIAMKYRNNFNGSQDRVAAITDVSGCMLLTMPHPERGYSDFSNKNFFIDKYFSSCNQSVSPNLNMGENLIKNAFNYFL
ncbi:phosphoribosylformylglycinamidine synthase subunit PurQ [Anaplasmataceae bacterium AB001_6]|nr:phosphoribosylformylglycinamidine synthase subunit PurQ [Anaplasmataceae bacterium AB001_6]